MVLHRFKAMYTDTMKRLQIHIEEEVDARLTQLGRERGMSKAALIRESVQRALGPPAISRDDHFLRLRGDLADPGATPAAPAERVVGDQIDEVVYGTVDRS